MTIAKEEAILRARELELAELTGKEIQRLNALLEAAKEQVEVAEHRARRAAMVAAKAETELLEKTQRLEP